MDFCYPVDYVLELNLHNTIVLKKSHRTENKLNSEENWWSSYENENNLNTVNVATVV